MLSCTFRECSIRIGICFRTIWRVFNLRRFIAWSKTFQTVVCKLLYADDADVVAHTERNMQVVVDRFSNASTAIWLTVSLKKKKVIFRPPNVVP